MTRTAHRQGESEKKKSEGGQEPIQPAAVELKEKRTMKKDLKMGGRNKRGKEITVRVKVPNFAENKKRGEIRGKSERVKVVGRGEKGRAGRNGEEKKNKHRIPELRKGERGLPVCDTHREGQGGENDNGEPAVLRRSKNTLRGRAGGKQNIAWLRIT